MKLNTLAVPAALLFAVAGLSAQDGQFDAISGSLSTLIQNLEREKLFDQPGKPHGRKGEGRHGRRREPPLTRLEISAKAGKSTRLSVIEPKKTFTLAEIDGQGAIQHIWMTPTGNWRFSIIRMYWDGEKEPSVEAPVGDFFAMGWGKYAPIRSLAVCVNPGSAFNSYWPMPFRKKAVITMENLDDSPMRLYYQVDYTITQVPKDAGYFHAQFRRINPLPYKEVYTIVDNLKGKGHYVGTYMAWGVNNTGWWGEGEIKFFMDGDRQFPTIVGTGTEDYFCGSYNFENKEKREYEAFTTPYSGLAQVIKPDGLYESQQRFGLYRWHIADPIRFESDLRVTIQALGWRSGRRYLPLKDDIASVAYWYQLEPHGPFPKLPANSELEVN